MALKRVPFYDDSAALLDHLNNEPYQGYIAWHSIANLFYLLRPTRQNRPTRVFLADLLSFLTVATGTNRHLIEAATSPINDFEDAMQVAAAQACGATFIATRNLSDYSHSPVSALSPAEALAKIKKPEKRGQTLMPPG